MFCIAVELLRPDAPQASGLDSRRAVFAEHHSRRSAGRARARGEAFRQGKLADAGMRERGTRTRDSEERKGGQCPPGKRRKRRARRAEPHDEAGACGAKTPCRAKNKKRPAHVDAGRSIAAEAAHHQCFQRKTNSCSTSGCRLRCTGQLCAQCSMAAF